jgi:hypothetical protein
MSLFLITGLKYEKSYKESKILPDSSKADSEDEEELLKLISELI